MKHKALWAVDPIDANPRVDRATARGLAEWCASGGLEITPVYVFTPVTPVEALAKDHLERAMGEALGSLDVPAGAPAVLMHPASSTGSAAKELLDFATREKASVILLTARSHQGAAHWLFGSFTERVLRQSPLPLLMLNRRPASGTSSFRRALFATDFSAYARTAYERFLKQFSGLVDEVVVFHDGSVEVELASFASGLSFDAPSDAGALARGLARTNLEDAEKWMEMARAHGIASRYFQRDGAGDVSQTILTAARLTQSGLVVMASVVGPLSALLLGSHARQLIEAGELPILLYGPQACKGSF